MKQGMIKQLQKDIHRNAKEKGFWDCRFCKDGYLTADPNASFRSRSIMASRDAGFTREEPKCHVCDGSHYHRNAGESLSLIHSEIDEIFELFEMGWTEAVALSYKASTMTTIVGDFKAYTNIAEELADVFIRTLDFSEGHGLIISLEGIEHSKGQFDDMIQTLGVNEESVLYLVAKMHAQVSKVVEALRKEEAITEFICGLLWLVTVVSEIHEFDIMKAVEWKMKYNSGRPHKHGKVF